MNPISFGQAKLSDALRISVLLQTVYIQTYDIAGITIESANYVSTTFALKRIETLIMQQPNRFIVAYHKENVVGVAEIIYDSICPIRKLALPELGKLYVLEHFKGKGIGYGLLNEVEKEVLNHGFKEFWFYVYIHNLRAVAFYERQGYASIGIADYKMEHNTYKNYVMNKVLG